MQLRSGQPIRCELVHGEPAALLVGRLGPVAIFEADRMVAYRVASRRRSNVFVFRTLPVVDRMAARVPGVEPRVRLVIHAQGQGPAEQLRRLFAHLRKEAYDAEILSDLFYRRIGHAVSRRRPTQAPLRGLLLREVENQAAHEPSPIARSRA